MPATAPGWKVSCTHVYCGYLVICVLRWISFNLFIESYFSGTILTLLHVYFLTLLHVYLYSPPNPSLSGKCCTSSTPPSPLRPYNIGCFRGCPFSDTRTTNQERNPDRGAYLSCKPGIPGTLGDFVPSVSSYATEVFSRSNEVSSAPEEVEVDNGEYMLCWLIAFLTMCSLCRESTEGVDFSRVI